MTNLEKTNLSAGLLTPDRSSVDLNSKDIGSIPDQVQSGRVQAMAEGLNTFQSLDPMQKVQALEILNNLNGTSPSEKISLLNGLLKLRTPDGDLAIQSSYQGQTLLSHLSDIAKSPLHSELQGKTTNAEILTSLVRDINNVGNVNQGQRATCTVTTLQWSTCKFEPAAYAGMLSDLSLKGETAARDGSSPIQLGEYVSADTRSASSRILQTAMMKAASDSGYDAETDTVGGKVGQHTGLYSRQVETLYEKFTGKAFARIDSGNSNLITHLEDSLAANKVNMVCIEGLGTGADALHAVTVTEISGGYVYFRNPWGKEYNDTASANATLVDADQSIFKIPISQFISQTSYAMIQEAPGAKFGVTPGATDENAVEFFTEGPGTSKPISIEVAKKSIQMSSDNNMLDNFTENDFNIQSVSRERHANSSQHIYVENKKRAPEKKVEDEYI